MKACKTPPVSSDGLGAIASPPVLSELTPYEHQTARQRGSCKVKVKIHHYMDYMGRAGTPSRHGVRGASKHARTHIPQESKTPESRRGKLVRPSQACVGVIVRLGLVHNRNIDSSPKNQDLRFAVNSRSLINYLNASRQSPVKP